MFSKSKKNWTYLILEHAHTHFCRVQSCIQSSSSLRIKETSETAMVKFGKSVLQVNSVFPHNTSPMQANFHLYQGNNKRVCQLNCLFRTWHHVWLLFICSLHKHKKRSGHHVILEENVPIVRFQQRLFSLLLTKRDP